MKNLFGTDGIRAKVGTYPFTPNDLTQLSNAIAQWLAEKYTKPIILIAQDTRESCDWIKHSLISSLLPYGVDVYDAKILPTPAVLHLMKNDESISCGLVISASHNPYTDNGIKLIDKITGKISEIDELKITDYFHNASKSDSLHFGKYSVLPNPGLQYSKAILSTIHLNHGKELKIVLDTSNGATYKIAPYIFKKLGIQVHTIYNKPSGTNINKDCGALHVQGLIKEVVKLKANAGFAFDGDGDRIIAVNRLGEIKDGDDVLALLLEHPNYKNEKFLIGTVMSNQGLSKHCIDKKITLIRTNVGDKYVSQALKTNNALLGGEQSGHIILRDIIPTGDGILVALKILETMHYTQNFDMQTFQKFPQMLLNIPITKKNDLNAEPYISLIEKAEKRLLQGRLLVRYSGTELILRIMAEAETHDLAKAICLELADDIANINC